ncbi:MAG TPA: flagellar motor switch protein FliG [Acidobacteriaceae bacterium]|nr:flagellar motor switch protein FliG [Acidobacteriaceae bacterium]
MATAAMFSQPGFGGGGVSGLRKAAILMVAVGDEIAKLFFQTLSNKDVQQVIDEITRLGEVPQAQLTQVLVEFYGLLETEQYSFRGGPDYASRLLAQAFGKERADEMMVEVEGLREKTHGDLSMLQKMDPQQLSKFLENEHPQTVALVLAHLDSKKGSTLLMLLEPERRVETVKRLAEMRQFSPEMAVKVGVILHRRMDAMGSTGRRSYAGFKSVADMLNRLDMVSSKTILEELEKEQPKLAIGIRNLMFTFEDLLTVPESAIREIVAAVDKRVLAMALKGAKENLKAHLLKAMSSRAVEMLKDDMDAMGPVRTKEVARAQQEMLTLAHALESEGKITLKMEADDELAV